jgi:hypothetical protein
MNPEATIPAVLVTSQGSGLERSNLDLIVPPAPDSATVALRLAEINDSWRYLAYGQVSHSLRFETALVNEAAKANGVDAEFATMRACLRRYPGNAVELAQNALPDRARLYGGSLGSEGSSALTPSEMAYVRRTGRYTFDDTDGSHALPTVQAYADSIVAAGLAPTRITANSAGAVLGTALLTALPENSVTHFLAKGRPNLKDAGMIGLLVRMVVVEGVINDRLNQYVSRDPERLTKLRIEGAMQLLTNIYTHAALPKQTLADRKARFIKLYTDWRGFTHGPQTGNPAVLDTRAALRQQPNLHITYHQPLSDGLTAGQALATTEAYLHSLRAVAGLSCAQRVCALVIRGTHADHSQYPARRRASEHFAFTVDQPAA